jgi:hypothetical protein
MTPAIVCGFGREEMDAGGAFSQSRLNNCSGEGASGSLPLEG